MALLHFDGFDGYATTAQVNMRYPVNNSPNMNTTAGRFGGGAISSGYVVKSISGSPSTVITGAVFSPSTNSITMFDWRNASGTQAVLYWNMGSGNVELRRTSQGGTLLGSFGQTSTGIYRHWEVKFVCHASTGACEVRVDGVTVLNLTGINTMGQAAADITGVYLGTTTTFYADDWYILDTTGSAPLNNFIGDCRITTIRPTADSSVAWTRSTGSTNAAAIDDTTVDATDYVASSTVGQRDIYDLGDLSGSPTVYAMQATAWGLKTDAGTRGVKVGLRYSGNETQSADTPMTTTTSPYSLTAQATAPGAVAWTPAVVNSTQLTLEVGS